MIAYTVTCEFEDVAIADEFAQWLAGQHVGDVCAAGAESGEVLRMDGSPPTCEARYHFESREALETYEREHAPRLRSETKAWLGDAKVTFRRSVAEVIDDPMNVTAPWQAL